LVPSLPWAQGRVSRVCTIGSEPATTLPSRSQCREPRDAWRAPQIRASSHAQEHTALKVLSFYIAKEKANERPLSISPCIQASVPSFFHGGGQIYKQNHRGRARHLTSWTEVGAGTQLLGAPHSPNYLGALPCRRLPQPVLWWSSPGARPRRHRTGYFTPDLQAVGKASSGVREA
jgi:hypothetical protein